MWSDVACPWCYIGKRRLENALNDFEEREGVTLVWRSFQLDPQAPKQAGIPVAEMLAEKYGVSLAEAQAMNERVAGLAAEVGLEFRLDEVRYGNTFDAHRLVHFAAARGAQARMKERLFAAYFTEGEDLGDDAVLARLAEEIGLDGEEARAALSGEAFADEVLADRARAGELGIRGVPFYLIDEKLAISGAQPLATFTRALEKAWADAKG
ncbi:MAG: DsbA family oxidoreductase [Spirochaetes bacterium]|nr:DsbA family oxidoreductase [Spirochaetota bacterium]